jgi:6-phosphogluconolactonase
MTPLLLIVAVAAGFEAGAAPPPAGEVFVYIGTYTGAKSRGIYVSRLDLATGRLSPPELAAESENPSFLALHPDRPLLYAVNETGTFEGQKAGSVSGFAIDDATGRLRSLNRVSSRGADPCHLVVDASGKNVLVANYSGGSVASLPIGKDGQLQPASAFVQHTGSSVDSRQKGPHAHAVGLDGRNRLALVADLGLDKLLLYRFDPERGTLAPSDPPFASLKPGAGPRHFVIHPDGKHVYVVNEIDLTVTAFAFAAEKGTLTAQQSLSTLPAGVLGRPEDSTAEIAVHPGGRFLYASNRGTDTIAVFSIDGMTGQLAPVAHGPTGGKTPRNFAIDPSGRYLLAANQKSDSVVVFRMDPDTGRLTPAGSTVEVGAPVCLVFRARPLAKR